VSIDNFAFSKRDRLPSHAELTQWLDESGIPLSIPKFDWESVGGLMPVKLAGMPVEIELDLEDFENGWQGIWGPCDGADCAVVLYTRSSHFQVVASFTVLAAMSVLADAVVASSATEESEPLPKDEVESFPFLGIAQCAVLAELMRAGAEVNLPRSQPAHMPWEDEDFRDAVLGSLEQEFGICLLYTSDAADDMQCVDLCG